MCPNVLTLDVARAVFSSTSLKVSTAIDQSSHHKHFPKLNTKKNENNEVMLADSNPTCMQQFTKQCKRLLNLSSVQHAYIQLGANATSRQT